MGGVARGLRPAHAIGGAISERGYRCDDGGTIPFIRMYVTRLP